MSYRHNFLVLFILDLDSKIKQKKKNNFFGGGVGEGG